MKLFGRKISVRKIPALAGEALMMIPQSLAFRNPAALWGAYVRRQLPSGGVVRFRDGMNAWLSDNPHDGITLMVIFCKREYGMINPGSLVIDIGANIGMFSLYAVRSGAERLLAFEPNPSSHTILVKNLSQPSVKTAVSLYQLAVSGAAGETVYMPADSSPYNKTINAPTDSSASVAVETTSLDKIVEQCEGRRIDFLKMDCEGAEWEILTQCSEDALSQVDRIRMEFHPRAGRSKSEIIDRLVKCGFQVVHSQRIIVWLDRKSLLR